MGRPLSRGFALCCDQGSQGHAVWDRQGAAVLLDEVSLLEAREKPAHGLARSADHLPDLFVSQVQFHLGGVCGCRVLVGPSHHLAGGVRKYEVADFAACASVILADVLGDPKGNFAVLAHEAQQIALPQEVDLGRLLGLGCGFILAPRNYSGDS
jgi:hypothetical protein